MVVTGWLSLAGMRAHSNGPIKPVEFREVAWPGGAPASDGVKLARLPASVQSIEWPVVAAPRARFSHGFYRSGPEHATTLPGAIQAQTTSSTKAFNWPLVMAPTLVACTLPSRKIISVGMPRMAYC